MIQTGEQLVDSFSFLLYLESLGQFCRLHSLVLQLELEPLQLVLQILSAFADLQDFVLPYRKIYFPLVSLENRAQSCYRRITCTRAVLNSSLHSSWPFIKSKTLRWA